MPTANEVRKLLIDAETVLRKRRQDTTDPGEKQALAEQIDELRTLKDLVDFTDLNQRAGILNQLADNLEAVVTSLRTRPFDQVLGELQGLFNRIGEMQGSVAHEIRPPQIPEPTPATEEPAPVTAPSPAAAPASAIEPAPVFEPVSAPAPLPTPAPAAEAPPVMPMPAEEEETPSLKQLWDMFASCRIRSERISEIDLYYVEPFLKGRKKYELVGAQVGVPWWFIGILHGLESTFSFETHLHNGDPLTNRTINVPRGRPVAGEPPFSWVESAMDALICEKLDNVTDWSLPSALDRFERYNGLGYRKMGLPSPYLWSFSTHYERGKYGSDSKYDPDLVSKQCGAAVLLKRLIERNILRLDDQTRQILGDAGLAIESTSVLDALTQVPSFAQPSAKAELEFPGLLRNGIKDSKTQRRVQRVQEWCCFHRANTNIDGEFGFGTMGAVQRFQREKGLPESGEIDERTWIELTLPLRRAISPIKPVKGSTIYDAVLAVARQHLAEHPIEFIVKGVDNCGPWVRLYMNGKDGAGQFWCAGFVSYVVGQAASALGIPMPLKRQVGVDQLVADAEKDGRLVRETDLPNAMARRTRLRAGALFVVRDTPKDWTHTGIVTRVNDDNFETIEGNTNQLGSNNGFEVCERSRPYRDKDFILLI